MGLGAIYGAGAGLVGSLLGGGAKAPQNPYAGNVTQGLGQAASNASSLTNLGGAAQSTYNQFSPQANAATEGYANYLEQNPYTDTASTQALSRATLGTTQAYQQSRARLLADQAANGTQNSGLVSGGLADIDNAYAGQTANAENELAMQQAQQLGQNKASLADLLNGRSDSAYNQAQGAYGSAGNLNNETANSYANFGQQEVENQQQADNAQGSLWGDVGSGIGGLLGGKSGGGGNDTVQQLLQMLKQTQGQNGQNPNGNQGDPNNPYNQNSWRAWGG